MMNHASLERSLQANRAYYARMFVLPTGEQVAVERKQLLSYFSRETANMELRLRALEFQLFSHTGYHYRPAWTKRRSILSVRQLVAERFWLAKGILAFPAVWPE